MLNKKKEQPKPSKFKIEMSLDKCKDSIQELLDKYESEINSTLAKVTSLKKEGRVLEAKHCMDRIKMLSTRQAKMLDMYDRVDQFSFMIQEAFAKNEFASTLNNALNEVSQISMTLDVKGMLKELNKFEDVFGKTFNSMDAIFDKVTKSVDDVDQSTSAQMDAEIEARVNAQMARYEEQTDAQANGEDVDNLFSL